MSRSRIAILLFTLSLSLSAETLKDVFARMDASAGSFKGVTAKVRKVSYTAVIKDSSEEKGSVVIRRAKAKETQLRMDLTSPDAKTWVFRGKRAELYLPKINTVQEYDLGRYSKLLDQFLLLGFGSTSVELLKAYRIQYGAEEMVDGQKASRIELTPVSEEAQRHLKRVEIWFPLSGGLPIQQKFFQTSGDYVLVNYADVKVEPNLPESAAQLNLPKTVKREYPQK